MPNNPDIPQAQIDSLAKAFKSAYPGHDKATQDKWQQASQIMGPEGMFKLILMPDFLATEDKFKSLASVVITLAAERDLSDKQQDFLEEIFGGGAEDFTDSVKKHIDSALESHRQTEETSADQEESQLPEPEPQELPTEPAEPETSQSEPDEPIEEPEADQEKTEVSESQETETEEQPSLSPTPPETSDEEKVETESKEKKSFLEEVTEGLQQEKTFTTSLDGNQAKEVFLNLLPESVHLDEASIRLNDDSVNLDLQGLASGQQVELQAGFKMKKGKFILDKFNLKPAIFTFLVRPKLKDPGESLKEYFNQQLENSGIVIDVLKLGIADGYLNISFTRK